MTVRTAGGAKGAASTPLGALGIIEVEAAEPVLTFAIARGMTYRTRIRVVAVLVGAAILLQVVFFSVFPGLPLLAAAVLLSWVVGFDTRLDRRGLPRDPAWENAPYEKVDEIVALDAAMTKWDESATDISSRSGCGMWFAAAGAITALAVLVASTAGAAAAAIVGVDAAFLVLLQWFSGMRTVQRRPDLVLKARHLSEVVRGVRPAIESCGGRLQGQLQMSGPTEGREPTDVRISVAFAAPKGDVLTVQGQVVLNRVQGAPYPYFYAVVVSTAGRGLLQRAGRMSLPDEVILEPKSDKAIEIVVLRQRTTNTSGYHTSEAKSRTILTTALQLAAAQAAVAVQAGATARA